MEGDSKAVAEFQRRIVEELLGKVPGPDPDIPDGDVCEALSQAARAYADKAVRTGLAPGYEDTVVEAVVIHAMAAAAVRWGECAASVRNPQAQGAILARMMSETMSASYGARAISGEFRMAPWRGKEVLNYREHCSDGKVDFDSWAAVSEDPEFVVNLKAIFELA